MGNSCLPFPNMASSSPPDNTLLIQACRSGSLSLAQELTSPPPSPLWHSTACELEGISDPPLTAAVRSGSLPLVEWILSCLGEEGSVDAPVGGGCTALHLAAFLGHKDIAVVLVEAGSEIAALEDNNSGPLHFAAQENQVEIATWLLEIGAEPFAPRDGGWTPLALGAQFGHVGIVELLVVAGDVDVKLEDGSTPLHLAAGEGHLDVVKALVQHGANVNAFNTAGVTPLTIAGANKHIPVVQFLVTTGQANLAQALGQ